MSGSMWEMGASFMLQAAVGRFGWTDWMGPIGCLTTRDPSEFSVSNCSNWDVYRPFNTFLNEMLTLRTDPLGKIDASEEIVKTA